MLRNKFLYQNIWKINGTEEGYGLFLKTYEEKLVFSLQISLICILETAYFYDDLRRAITS